MRFVRCLLLMLLAINLPGFGGAFAAMPQCAMQHAQSNDGAALPMASSDTHAAHCCADGGQPAGDTAQDHGCQNGMQCQCGALYHAAQPVDTPVQPASPGIAPMSSLHLPPQIVVPLLRPPIALTLR